MIMAGYSNRLIIFLCAMLWCCTVVAKPVNYRVETVATGLHHPWGLAFLPNGDMLVTERKGRLRLIRNQELLATPISGTPEVVSAGQGGLLDILVDPDFVNNHWIYLSYSGHGPGGVGTEVVRARLQNNQLIENNVIFRAAPKTSGTAHYGSRLAFAADGTLFISLGDRYRYLQEAQNTDNHLGAIVRIHPDGRIPKDNPFVGTPNTRPEIFSYGHRNVQGLALEPDSKRLWAHEHGPRGGDELNILQAGANYGWPAITYGIDYSGAIISEHTELPGMIQPIAYWDPSIAPSGMAFYNGDAFPAWQGNLFLGSLKFTHLRRLVINDNKVVQQEELLRNYGERIRDVRSGPDGFLYVLTDSRNGKLLKIKPQ